MQDKRVPIHLAVKNDWIKVIEKLIEKKADLDAENKVCAKFDVVVYHVHQLSCCRCSDGDTYKRCTYILRWRGLGSPGRKDCPQLGVFAH